MFIDTNAIIANARLFKSRTNVKLCAVVKSNAYGHGLVIVAQSLSNVADYFAVTNVQEANNIKQFCLPTLILLPLNSQDMMVAIDCGYEIIIDSIDTMNRLISLGVNYCKRAIVHLKVDTGMHRLGCELSQVEGILTKLLEHNVVVKGICSHCACGDDEKLTSMQRSVFDKACRIAVLILGYMPIRHFANTSATLANDKNHYDMVRIGLGLYGYGGENLSVAKHIMGNVLAVKMVSKGEYLGYGGYTAQNSGYIAIVDVGYANGIVNEMENIEVFCAPKAFSVVGRVCMSMIIVDIQKNVLKPFDQVEIIGNNTSIQKNSSCDIYQLLCNTK